MKGVTEEQSAFSDTGTSLPFLFLSVTLTLVVLFSNKKNYNQLCNTLNRLQTTNTFSLISTASLTQVMKNPVY